MSTPLENDMAKTAEEAEQISDQQKIALFEKAISMLADKYLALSAPDELLQQSITIAPNPSSGVFQIVNSSQPISTIEVYNVFGKKVYTSSVMTYQMPTAIDLSSHPVGMYLIRVV